MKTRQIHAPARRAAGAGPGRLPAAAPAPDGRGVVVSLEDVRKRYRTGSGWVEALRGVDLQVAAGTIQGVIGFSGAGKSTLVRCIARLEQPDTGRVLVNGVDLAGLDGAALRAERRRIGMVFQQFNLLRSRTVAANVALPLEIAGVDRAAARERVAELLEWVGLADKAAHHPAQLSGGQRQRVAIARALADRPDVLLSDEPTSALDPATTASVLQLLRRVRDELGVTILLITHELGAVRAICDRVAVLEGGRIVEEGPTREVLLRPESEAARRLLQTGNRHAGVPAPRPSRVAGEHSARVELQFVGEVAVEPVVAEAIQRFGVVVNFLAGQIDRLDQTPYGWLLADFAGAPAGLAASLAYLEGRGVRVTPVDVAPGGVA